MQRYTVYLYLETALHVSGGISTHHQEHIQLYLQHLVYVTPLLLSDAIVEELEPVWVCCGWRMPPTVQSALLFFKNVFFISLKSLQLFEIFHTFKEFIKFFRVFFRSFCSNWRLIRQNTRVPTELNKIKIISSKWMCLPNLCYIFFLHWIISLE
jgi:hypothetical protein